MQKNKSTSRTGDPDPLLSFMKMFGKPLNLETYVKMNWGEDADPRNLTAEQWSEVPVELLKKPPSD